MASAWGKSWGKAFGASFGPVAVIEFDPYDETGGGGDSQDDAVHTQIRQQNHTLVQLLVTFIASGGLHG